VGVVIRCALAAVLATAAVLKLRSASSRAALATFGVGPPWRRPVWSGIATAELALAAGVAAGSAVAAWVAAGLLAAFALLLTVAIARGREGAPCACFGSRSSVGWRGVARSAALAVAFALMPFVPTARLGGEGWLALGLGTAFVAIAGLGIAVLALAREVGMLRLQLGPQSALELADEGPPLGTETELAARFDPGPRARFALAVFTSEGCGMCRRLEPALAALAADPLVALEVFDEYRDRDVLDELAVPGSPYAVALDREGVVRAKGTFNSFGQLESVLGAAERRLETARV
jgi:Methylamine utilisation protein MauE